MEPPCPTMVPAGVALQVPPHQSMGNGQEIHLRAFSTVDYKSVHDQEPKRGIKWIADSPSGMSGAQMDKWCPYPHSTTSQGVPHRRRRAHSIVALRSAPPSRRQAPNFHSTASPLDTCKETHLGAILCVCLFISMLIGPSPLTCNTHQHYTRDVALSLLSQDVALQVVASLGGSSRSGVWYSFVSLL